MPNGYLRCDLGNLGGFAMRDTAHTAARESGRCRACLTCRQSQTQRWRVWTRFPRRLIEDRLIRYVKRGRYGRIPERALRESIASRTGEGVRKAAEKRSGAELACGGCSPCTAKRPRSVTWAFVMERVTRIELALSAWEATALGAAPGCCPGRTCSYTGGRRGRDVPLRTLDVRSQGHAEGTESWVGAV